MKTLSIKSISIKYLTIILICSSFNNLIPDNFDNNIIINKTMHSDINYTEYKFYKGAGCKACGNTGYHGRIGIYEIMRIDHEYHKLINDADIKGIEEIAIKKGMKRMVEDGIQKALKGFTTLEEVLKAAQF